jgi:NADH dehydrogenase FAD-containing subunit
MGVEVRLGSTVEHIDEDGVIAGVERIRAATVIWSAGVRATSVGQWLGVRTARNGAVPVDLDLWVPIFPEVFVLGDAALLAGPDGTPLPGLAAVAQQQGRYVGALIAARVAGRAEDHWRRAEAEVAGVNSGAEAPPGTAGASEHICPACDGTGRIDRKKCASCGGTGYIIEVPEP